MIRIKLRKWTTAAVSAALLASLTAGSALAFSDVDEELQAPIAALQSKGIVSGIDEKHFAPRAQATYAQSIHMLVKAFELSLAHIQFIKAPEASDYYTKVPNDAWYAESFIIAQLNGLPIPKDVDPRAAITREQFANLLIHAIDTKGSFPVIEMLVQFADQDEMDPNLNDSLQRMVLHGIVKLGEDRKFYPKRELTRGEAAAWVHSALAFVERMTKPQQPQEEIKISVEKINDDVNKVVLSRGQKPTAGYGIDITGIRFDADGRAVISYTLSDPAPDSMTAAVITEPKAVTYVSSAYKAVAEQDFAH
ncbi:S-layer homology domain-containing protein [Paenibacillus sp. UNCCL117]|uniref:S-layer homology domain-containing protein n=1 Tax=unclassified Paenibacillus TaxID=185978 RepID=UPI00087FADDA|nr:MULTISPECIES: S-layer homology domain-containing protein [unclassified Paenibacillus]SDD61870.1 S-layer homology domain-containing protein [Paenibacillus sp. cl123]SFW67573.1 S-layer homology domain-containing protein [Paenibacillus sp. UNCCL117]